MTNYICTDICVEDALDKAYLKREKIKWALVYLINMIKFVTIEDLEQIDRPNVVEAHFFSEDKEIHVFEYHGNLKAVEIKDGDLKEGIIDREYELEDQFAASVKDNKMTVRNYIGYDDDGQAFISVSRLCGVYYNKGGEINV